jgi:uncharacterized protein (DUF2062 family)
MPPFQPHASPAAALLQRLLVRLRALLTWLWAQEGSPGQRARGLAAGIFCGCFPFFGLQTLLGVALASALRGNHLLAAAGTWISNPFTYLPLYWFNYRLGCWLIGPADGWPGVSALRGDSLRTLGWSVASRLLLGSALVGLLASAAGGGLYWLWLERDQRRRVG